MMRNRIFFLLVVVVCVFLSACRSSHFPKPVQTTREGNHQVLSYDLNRDRQVDYQQVVSTDGGISELRYDTTGDGQLDHSVDTLNQVPTKKVLIGLDGVPYGLMRELYDEGYFQIFYPPSRNISALPAITEMYLTQFFNVRFPGGYGLSFFNKETNRVEGSLFHRDEIEIWEDIYDYISPLHDKGIFYVIPDIGPADNRAMKRVIRRLVDSQDLIMMHLDATDSLGHKFGRERMEPLLKDLDRSFHEIYHEYQGALEIILYSDHGNNFAASERIEIEAFLEEQGFDMRSSGVHKDGDVFILATGLISAAYLYMKPETEPKVAEALRGLEGVLFSAYADETKGDVYAVSRDGSARIRREGEYFCYEQVSGDPLGIAPALTGLTQAGKVRFDGFVHDRDWLEALEYHHYPDIVNRCYGAVTSHVKNKADVMVFLDDGWLCGSPAMNLWLRFESTHASPLESSITGILMSTHQAFPETVRCEDVLDVIGLRDPINQRLHALDIEMR